MLGYPGCNGRGGLIHPDGRDYFLGCNEGNGIQRSNDGTAWVKVKTPRKPMP